MLIVLELTSIILDHNNHLLRHPTNHTDKAGTMNVILAHHPGCGNFNKV